MENKLQDPVMPDSFKKIIESGLSDSVELQKVDCEDECKKKKSKKVVVMSLKEEEDKIINDILDNIWNTYNTDKNEYLDKNEMS